MVCLKKPYTKKKAQEVLNTLILEKKWNHKDKGRIYQCDRCPHWHITHLKEYDDDKTKGNLHFVSKWAKLLKKQNKK